MSGRWQEIRRLAEAATQGKWQVVAGELPCRMGAPHLERRIFTAKNHPQLKGPYPVVSGSVALGDDCRPVHHMVSITAEDAEFIAAANPIAVVTLLDELETERERANYWKQRAKSAEGHLFANDVRAAAKALHANTTQNETPFEELSEEDRQRRFRGAWTVVAAINAERNRRKPKDSPAGEAWCECGDGPSDGFVCPNCLVANGWSCGAEIDALKVEARRYRWLRDECGIVEYRALTRSTNASGMLPSGDTLDEAIDAAMAGGTHG